MNNIPEYAFAILGGVVGIFGGYYFLFLKDVQAGLVFAFGSMLTGAAIINAMMIEVIQERRLKNEAH